MENQFAADAGGVDRFLEAYKPNLHLFQLCNHPNQVFQGPTKAIKTPDDQGITFSEVR